MRQILLTFFLTSVGALAAPPDAPTTVELVGTWVERMTIHPARTGVEVAEYFERLGGDDWRETFAVELRLFGLIAVLERFDRDAGDLAAKAELRAVGLDPHVVSLGHAREFARTFLTKASRARPPAFPALLAHLLETGGSFWANRIIEELIERAPISVEFLTRVLWNVPAAAYPRAARAIAAAQYDARDARSLMDALVLAQALRGTPLPLEPSADATADRQCQRLLGESIALLRIPPAFR